MSYSRIKLIISYDGTNYYGFQAQKDFSTIEKELKKALYKMTGADIKIYGAGRTDKGVHAKGQVVHFDTQLIIRLDGWIKGLNTYLPLDIRVLKAEIVNSDFHSRFSAVKKEYHYQIMTEYFDLFRRDYAVYCPNLNIDKMEEASKLFVGTHNFRGFCSVDVNELKNFEKTIYEINIIKSNNLVEFKFIGDGFLKYQIRRMMGLLIEIGLNKKDKSFIVEVLEKKDSRLSHKVADACGLYLIEVTY